MDGWIDVWMDGCMDGWMVRDEEDDYFSIYYLHILTRKMVGLSVNG